MGQAGHAARTAAPPPTLHGFQVRLVLALACLACLERPNTPRVSTTCSRVRNTVHSALLSSHRSETGAFWFCPQAVLLRLSNNTTLFASALCHALPSAPVVRGRALAAGTVRPSQNPFSASLF